MYAAIATEPGDPSKPNEDWVGASPTTLVLLDGLSSPQDTDNGCVHGTPWYVQQLGSRLLIEAADPSRSLQDALAEAIRQVSSLHPQCDLTRPGAPATTVAILRCRNDSEVVVDYLVLSDALAILNTLDGIQVITDDRVESVASPARQAALQEPIGSRAHRSAMNDLVAAQRPLRNHPDGYWVASSDPSAAEHALTGSLSRSYLTSAALLSDGASRLVDVFEQVTWRDALALLDGHGPMQLIQQVRDAEHTDPDGRRWPRYKKSDDATILHVRW